MWEEEEVINAIELLPADVCRSGKVEHVFEADGWFLAVSGSFADEAGPHCVVKFEVRVAHNGLLNKARKLPRDDPSGKAKSSEREMSISARVRERVLSRLPGLLGSWAERRV